MAIEVHSIVVGFTETRWARQEWRMQVTLASRPGNRNSGVGRGEALPSAQYGVAIRCRRLKHSTCHMDRRVTVSP
jgi:hypothetical protein